MDCWLLGSAMFECLLSLFAQETPRLRLLLIPSVRDWERGYIVQTGTCSDWPPHRSVNYKTIVASSMAPLFFFSESLKFDSKCQAKHAVMDIFCLSNYVNATALQFVYHGWWQSKCRSWAEDKSSNSGSICLFVFLCPSVQTCLYLLSALMKKL